MAGDQPAAADRPRRGDTRDPRGSRLAALRVLYAADLRGEDPLEVLERSLRAPSAVDRARAAARSDAEVSAAAARGAEPSQDPEGEPEPAELDGFAVSLVRGVTAERTTIDARIARLAQGWKLTRMPVIDRNVLRLAIHELIAEPTPTAVVLDEAVRLVGELSTDASGRFVNGVLAAVVRELAREEAASGEDLGPSAEEVPPASP